MNETYTLPFWQWRQIAFHLRQAATYWHRLGNDAELHLDLPDFAAMLHDRARVCHEYADQFSARPSGPPPAAPAVRNDPSPSSGGRCTCTDEWQCNACYKADLDRRINSGACAAEARIRERLGLGPQPAMATGGAGDSPDSRAWQTGEH